jgi:hypothetical protein
MSKSYPDIYKNIKRYIFESKIEDVRKKGLTVLGLPKNIDKIPEWCIPYINYDKIVTDNTNKMRSILESLGVQIIETDSTTKRYSNIVKF